MFRKLIYFIGIASSLSSISLVPVVGDSDSNSCTLPPFPDHGIYSSRGVPNGKPGSHHSNVILLTVCEQGYDLKGAYVVSCNGGQWSGEMPQCVPKNISANAGMKEEITSMRLDDEKRSPTPEVPNKQTTPTTMRPVNDRRPDEATGVPDKPTTQVPDDPYPIRYPGPVSDGTSTNGCILPKYPDHGTFTSTNSLNVFPGHTYDFFAINVTCQEGYVVNRRPLVFCSRGQWSGEMPQCLSRCRLNQHPSLIYRCRNPVEWGDETIFRDCNEYEPEGTLAKPVCQTYYQAVTTLTYMKCKNGQWTNYVQQCVPQCGVFVSKNQLVANGTIAKVGEIPWHSAIYRKTTRPYDLICGGSLISTKIVISAAHCFWNDFLLNPDPASDFVVAFGKVYRDFDNRIDESQSSNVEAIHVPSRFRGQATNFQDDIAVLELATVVQYRAHIRPVCVDFDDSFENRQLQPGNLGKVAGWGLTSESGNTTEKLRTVELPYVQINTCFDTLPETFTMFITSDKICAGYENAGTSVCKGDSGGGLAFPEPDKGTLRYYLRGVVSTAPTDNDNACNTDTYTTFTRLSNHETFLTLYWRD